MNFLRNLKNLHPNARELLEEVGVLLDDYGFYLNIVLI